ncbi:glycosyltransferase [Nocardioides mangrovicus]|uniref:Glycosyltransferase n=1 Tax=Nocardioides mangrovicus TaxID=2478913 RepID=A0A3L8P5K8_9ACTN|nr:glycosyltransferase [Nocardioides mangrovicus]RLV49688.1 glycosyltransferase [Nocardioides mangrovicus]
MTEPQRPMFSIITPVFDPPVEALRETIQSVRDQRFENWELILVDDCSTDPAILPTLREAAAADSRIRVIARETNGHISVASNDGIDAARGEFIALLDHDDLLTPRALRANAYAIAAEEDVDYLYSDEEITFPDGEIIVFKKPDWSPERLRAQNYCNHLSVYRTTLLREVGGFREGFEGAQDHDLVLRVSERARRIVHISKVLYRWRAVPGSTVGDEEAKPYAFSAGQRAVQEHLDRVGIEGRVEFHGPGIYRIERTLPAERRVSIIVPTIGSTAMVWGRPTVMVLNALRTALEHTEHPNVEVVVVADEPTPPKVLQEIRAIVGDRLVLVYFREKFNYSRKVNFGVLRATGDRIVILNDDTEVVSDRWLETLLAPLEEESVGMTGAKLSYSSGTLQHAGLAWSRGYYIHPFREWERDDYGPFGILGINREVSGVTGACVGIRRETFLEVGGLSEELWNSFNDVDFSYKIEFLGYRTVFVATCELFHFETMTRKGAVADWEYRAIRRRWGRPTNDRFTPDFPELPPTGQERRARESRDKRRRVRLESAP